MRVDTILVLAGGKGTRSLDPSVPKVSQRISLELDVASFLLAQLEHFASSKVIWLISHHADQVVQRIEGSRANFEVSLDAGMGTSAAVRAALPQIKGEKVLILLGDCIMAAPLSKIISNIPGDRGTVFFGRTTDHPQDSDVLLTDFQGGVVGFSEKGSFVESQSHIPYGLSGITITDFSILNQPQIHMDIQKDIYLQSRELGTPVKLVKNSWYVRDLGTPQRLQRAQADFSNGSLQRRAKESRAAVFLDRDGTLIPNTGEARKKVYKHEVSESVVQSVTYANNCGVPVIMITNQPGIAKGFIEYTDFEETVVQLGGALRGAFLDDFYLCPHHPESGWIGEIHSLKIDCACRKPKPGMLERASKDHLLNIENSYLIGDTKVDELTAKGAGCNFIFAEWSESGLDVASAIRQATEKILDAYN